MVKVIWTDSAIEDLNDIGEYISKDSPKYAQLIVERLFSATDILEDHPNAGKVVEEFNNKSIRQLIRNNYRIVYLMVSENRIDILTVHHTARMITNSFNFNVVHNAQKHFRE